MRSEIGGQGSVRGQVLLSSYCILCVVLGTLHLLPHVILTRILSRAFLLARVPQSHG